MFQKHLCLLVESTINLSILMNSQLKSHHYRKIVTKRTSKMVQMRSLSISTVQMTHIHNSETVLKHTPFGLIRITPR